MAKIAPSLLSANFANLEEEINKIKTGGSEYLHLDVMDGNYVPNISFGIPVIKSLRNVTDLIFDVHLMIDKPERYIKDFVDAGADIITIHQEATTHLHSTIQQIKSYGIKAGVSLNPATPIDVLDYVISDIDLILIMSVNPGFGGQSFIPAMLEKIKTTRALIDEQNPNIILQVDGGIKLDNVQEIVNAGASLVVAGSEIFGAEDVIQRTKEFNKLIV
ncbi:MAG: ribulose-phosphate 3-epimerase [Tissierellaceae bacterium]|nr:ribulose-phosphate 3-epimerase [Tissierellaceae bacterium]